MEKCGTEAQRAAGRAGRRPNLTARQLAEVEAALEKGGRSRKGPEANGYGTDPWILAQVAERIEAVTRVSYHRGRI
jgi:hypothetical protein